jgi:magnesium transporter
MASNVEARRADFAPRTGGIEDRLDGLTALEEAILRAPPADAGGPARRSAPQPAGIAKRHLFAARGAGRAPARRQPLIKETTRPYLRDTQDHALPLHDLVETGRDLSTGLMNLILSMQAHRTSEIMRVLTIIATIFIPLTFVAGIYGMNFAPERSPWNMPELHWRFGYPAALFAMLLIAAGLLLFFRRKG